MQRSADEVEKRGLLATVVPTEFFHVKREATPKAPLVTLFRFTLLAYTAVVLIFGVMFSQEKMKEVETPITTIAPAPIEGQQCQALGRWTMRQGEVLSPIESFGFSALLDTSMTSAQCHAAVQGAEFCGKFADAFIGVGMDSCCMLGKHKFERGVCGYTSPCGAATCERNVFGASAPGCDTLRPNRMCGSDGWNSDVSSVYEPCEGGRFPPDQSERGGDTVCYDRAAADVNSERPVNTKRSIAVLSFSSGEVEFVDGRSSGASNLTGFASPMLALSTCALASLLSPNELDTYSGEMLACGPVLRAKVPIPYPMVGSINPCYLTQAAKDAQDASPGAAVPWAQSQVRTVNNEGITWIFESGKSTRTGKSMMGYLEQFMPIDTFAPEVVWANTALVDGSLTRAKMVSDCGKAVTEICDSMTARCAPFACVELRKTSPTIAEALAVGYASAGVAATLLIPLIGFLMTKLHSKKETGSVVVTEAAEKPEAI